MANEADQATRPMESDAQMAAVQTGVAFVRLLLFQWSQASHPGQGLKVPPERFQDCSGFHPPVSSMLRDDGPFLYGAVSSFKHFQERWTGVAADTWNPRRCELPDVSLLGIITKPREISFKFPPQWSYFLCYRLCLKLTSKTRFLRPFPLFLFSLRSHSPTRRSCHGS